MFLILGIHGQSIEIDPVAQPKCQSFWAKLKPVSIDMDNIAECEITEKKPWRSVFRIYFKKIEEFKHYEFEADTKLADQIVRKVSNIIKYLFTHVALKAEYEAFTAKIKKKTPHPK